MTENEMTETQADRECVFNIDWALHQERNGKVKPGEGVKAAHSFVKNHRIESTAALTAENAALKAKLDEAEAFRDRILAAVEFSPSPYGHSEERIAKDLSDGMSLRDCAAKHGTTFGIVRGIKKRLTTPEKPQ